MKIPPSSPRVTGGSTAPAADTDRAKGPLAKAVAGPSGGAAVQLSPLSTRLHALQSSLSGPEFNQTKVDHVQQAIRDGKLTIDTGVVADRMIDQAKNGAV